MDDLTDDQRTIIDLQTEVRLLIRLTQNLRTRMLALEQQVEALHAEQVRNARG